MKISKKGKYFFRILFVFLLVFVALNIAYESGYYETKSKNKAILTKDAMVRFEEDLKNGQMVDVTNYLEEDDIDYSTKVSKIGNKLSNTVSEFMTKGISGLFGALKGLFW
ncbi:MAG: hypothetical protein OSJ63_06500 [Bacilli bacterium]|nr:hypothetical protein [Bacilli bacterium]